MKILNFTSHSIFPPNTGGNNGIYRFLKYLGRKHEIILFTAKNSSGYKNNLPLKTVEAFNDGISKFADIRIFFRLLQTCRKEKPSVIILDYPWFSVYTILIRMFLNIPYYLHAHNVEYIRFKRYKRWWWRLLRAYEKFACRQAEKIFTKTTVDKTRLIRDFKIEGHKIIVVPYGYDEEIFFPNAKAGKLTREKLGLSKSKMVLFFGNLKNQSNQEALRIIEKKIAPNLNKKIKIVICGPHGPNMNKIGKNIIFTGAVSKIEDYINAADLIITPLTSGGGIRTRIIEAIACNKTVISTAIGAEGIGRKFCKSHLIIKNSWEKFANAINTLTQKNKKNTPIPQPFKIKYNWKNIVDKILK